MILKVITIKNSNILQNMIFVEFGKRIGVQKNRIEKLLNPFLVRQAFVDTLIAQSFLSEANKREYLLMYNRKRTFLNN